MDGKYNVFFFIYCIGYFLSFTKTNLFEKQSYLRNDRELKLLF